MARRKKKYSSKSSSDPVNTMVDLLGAAAMGAFVKHQVKQDYKNGKGEEAIEAATKVYGYNAMRRGSAGLIALGGLYGLNSAIRDIERQEQQARRIKPAYDDTDIVFTYKKNNNRYAWRLNCEDGSEYGIYPKDYETREAYNAALRLARIGMTGEEDTMKEESSEIPEEMVKPVKPYFCCRVSRLDNGANEYYLTENLDVKVGDTVTVQTDKGAAEGIVIGVRKLSEIDIDENLETMRWILADGGEDGTI